MRRLTALLTAFFVTGGAAGLVLSPASAAVRRVEDPIHQTVMSDGTVRYWISVRIGNSGPVETMMDSGSFGLRVLPGVLSPADYALPRRPNVYSYTSGVKIPGEIADTRVHVGSAATEAPIPIQVVRSVGCTKKKPRCPAVRIAQKDYRLGGKGHPGQGFKAIMGINMPLAGIQYPVVNPLTRMGGGAWIIVLPLPGQTKPGKLIINPDAADRAGFTVFPRLANLRRAEAASGCLHNVDTGRTFCGPVIIDTGAPGIVVNTFQIERPRPWPQGTQGAFVFRDAGHRPLRMRFAVNRAVPGSHVTIRPKRGGPPARIAAGILPYFSFAVLYDTRRNEMALRPRH